MPLMVAVLTCVAVPARAQEAHRLSAEESVRLGLAQNARLRAATADVSAADAALRQVRAGLLPALRGQAGYTRLSSNIPDITFTVPGTDSTVTFQSVELDQYQAQLSLQQTLFAGSTLRNQVRAAQHDVRAAELRAEQESSDVAFQIRQAYWQLYRAFALRDALARAQERVNTHLAAVNTRLQEGAALRRDLLAAQTRRSEVQLERVEADNAVRVGELELNRLLGLPLDTPLQLTGQVTLDTTMVSLDTLITAVQARQPQLAALEEDARSLRARLSAAQGGRWPQIDLVGRYTYARPNQYFFVEQNRFHQNWELGLAMRWNLWEGGRRSAETGELSARLEAAQARLADARTQAAVDVARKQLEVLRTGEAVTVAAQTVTEAEETFRVARQQFDEGVAVSADVLDAEEAFRRAQASQAKALADHAIARAALLNVLGRVW